MLPDFINVNNTSPKSFTLIDIQQCCIIVTEVILFYLSMLHHALSTNKHISERLEALGDCFTVTAMIASVMIEAAIPGEGRKLAGE